MARLTARFDLEDRITKKLKRINGELNRLEFRRKKLERPFIIRIEDRVSIGMKKIEKYMNQKALRSHQIIIRVRDLATKQIQRVNDFILRRLPKTHELILKAIDKTSPLITRLRQNLINRFGRYYEFGIIAKDRASKTMERVYQFAKRNLARGFTAPLIAIDRISQTVSRIAARVRATFSTGFNVPVRLIDQFTRAAKGIYTFASTYLNKGVKLTVRLIDFATQPLKKISNSATSVMNGGVVAPLKMVANRQNQTTSFEAMLGSREAADKRLDELSSFARQTPFTKDEIFEASHMLQISTGNALSTPDGLTLVGDIATGTQKSFKDVSFWMGRLYDDLESGHSIEMATTALRDMGVISGESMKRIQKLAKSGDDIGDIWPNVTSEFDRYSGTMLNMSNNIGVLSKGIKDLFQDSLIIPWGKGLSNAFQPALVAFREWTSENKDIINEIEKQIENAGEHLAQAILNPTSKVFEFIGDQLQILFEPDSNLTFKARWEIVWDNTQDVFSEWWNNVGEPGLNNMAKNGGDTYGGIINGIINGLLGVDHNSTGNGFIDIGATAGKQFVESFLEALNPADLFKKIGKKFLEINWGGFQSLWGKLTGNEELINKGSIAGALIADALVIGLVAKLMKAYQPIGNVLKKVFKKSNPKQKKNPRNDKRKSKGRNSWFGSFCKNDGKRKTVKNPVYTNPCLNKKKKPNWNKSTKNKKSGGNLRKVARKIPYLGAVLGAGTILAAPKEERAKAIGSVAGGLAGAAVGGTVGSFIPGVGTVIGGLAGGIGGAIGGEKFVDWLNDNNVFEKIEEKWTDTMGRIKGIWSDLEGWFSKKIWEPIKEGFSSVTDWLSDTWDNAKDWVKGKWSTFSQWFDEKVWNPLKNVGINTMNFFVGLWAYAEEWVTSIWNSFSDWFNEAVWTPLKEGVTSTTDWLSEKWDAVRDLVMEKWLSFSQWFNETVWEPIKEQVELVTDWISERWTAAKDWVIEQWANLSTWFNETVWEPLLEDIDILLTTLGTGFLMAWEGIKLIWGLVKEWFNVNIWEPISLDVENLTNSIGEFFSNGWNYVTEVWNDVSEWFNETVWTPIEEGVESVGEGIQGAFESAWAVVKPIWDQIIGAWNTVKGWGDTLKSWGGNVVKFISKTTSRGEEITGITPDKNYRGGVINSKTLSWIGEQGREYIIPTNTYRERGRMLLKRAANELGMSVHDKREGNQSSKTVSESKMRYIHKQESASSSTNPGDIVVHINGDNYYSDDQDSEKVTQKVIKAIQEILVEANNNGIGGEVYD
ncbi:hypothetical protein [Alkalihalobacillus trypoxylicola]|uniref:Phage tail tape measure protein domain-containing protein n=1 Tax=Alkalihalobacillus trypoxylicola TaxID=519424 RepID=A0A161PJA1_9BACI|nr:hypothetical protein [Alkalihalobacillus trypoxylicola]KYG33892.1 hypothetical protein AZF04_15375 [Alkalihalobacillus trypoxylicola]